MSPITEILSAAVAEGRDASRPIDDGGPAFPGDDGWTDSGTHYHGMTLRDWFAAQALAGMLVNQRGTIHENAGDAYKFADAMLKARNKK